MHASTILRRCLSSVLEPMHSTRCRVLLMAVEALIAGRRLTLTDLARSWPGAVWMHAPLKALDRLLSNRHMLGAVMPLHRAMLPWLIRQPQCWVIVDWSDLKRDGRWCLLRAAVPVKGRTLTLYEKIYPAEQLNSPRAQREFLRQLQRLLPAGLTPILVTDAGFRSDWFRAVTAQGWDYLGRVRNNTQVSRANTEPWQPCAALHPGASRKPRELGACRIVKGDPWPCRLVLAQHHRSHRDTLTRRGTPLQGTQARKARKSAREPWLLATSLPVQRQSATQLVAAYAQRMQIEEAFRDLKSHRYGMGLEDSLTRSAERLTVLLLLQTLALFAAWIMARAVAASGQQQDPLARQPKHRSRYSWMQRGIAWLHRPWPPDLRPWISRQALANYLDADALNT